MDVVRSVAGVPIRLTDERWEHILVGHPELTEERDSVLVVIEHPQSVMAGRDGVLLAVRPVDHRKWIVVAYVQNDATDGLRPERGGNGSRQPAAEGSPSRRPLPIRDTAPPQTTAPRKSSILQVSRSGQPRDASDDAPNTVTTSTTEADEPAVPDKSPDNKEAAKEAPPIGIMVRGDELIVTSEDKAALDRIENMFDTLASAIPSRTRWTIFYLRTADATETAQMLERLFPQSSVTASTSSSDGLFGSMTSGLSTLGRGMMNVTGLNQTLGGGGSLRIITDIRANALFVTGPTDTIREVEQMLEILDLAELPTDSLRDRTPRSPSRG